jgi:PAS domain S-box-containing protein
MSAWSLIERTYPMRLLAKLNFRTKIGLGTFLIVAFVSLATVPPAARMISDALFSEAKKRGEALVENLALRAVDPLLSMDLLRLTNMVDEVQAVSDDVEYAFVMDRQGKVAAHTFEGGFPVELRGANKPDGRSVHIQLLDTGRERIYDLAAPVLIAGDPFGVVRVGLSQSNIRSSVDKLVAALAFLATASLAGALLLSTVFARRVTRRLNILRSHAERLVMGDLASTTGGGSFRNCWEIRNCGLSVCPAHGDKERRCWYLAGTLCPECGEDAYPGKLDSCRRCTVYQQNSGDEIQDLAETFDVMAISLSTHIQELTEAQKDLTRQQNILRTVLDSTPDFVCLMDTDNRILAANAAFARFVGQTSSGVIGKTERDLFRTEEAEQRIRDNSRVLRTGVAEHGEMRVFAANDARWFHVVRVPVRDASGKVIGVLRTARDVTDLKTYEGQLIQAQKMESLGKLAGGVAHEINTPLGIILGYAQLLQEDVPSESSVHGDLKIIERQTKVCRKIVADLLGFSRQHESRKTEMDVNHSILEVVSLVRHAFSLDRALIETDLDEELPYMIGDREKLKQVWMNLLTNAKDAMDGGSIRVTSRLCEIGDKLVVSVADTGSGIEEENLKKVFDPFFSTKAVGKGTGLGLSVSYGIVEDHGGRIEAASPVPGRYRAQRLPKNAKRGPGAVFHVVLPLWPSHPDVEHQNAPGPAAKKENLD